MKIPMSVAINESIEDGDSYELYGIMMSGRLFNIEDSDILFTIDKILSNKDKFDEDFDEMFMRIVHFIYLSELYVNCPNTKKSLFIKYGIDLEYVRGFASYCDDKDQFRESLDFISNLRTFTTEEFDDLCGSIGEELYT